MRRNLVLRLPLLAMAGLLPAPAVQAQHEARDWPAGERWPAVAATDLQGRPWRLADLKGRAVLLNFWASWCEPCRSEMPTLALLAELYGPARLAVLALNYKEPPARIARYVQSTGLPLPVLQDPDGAAARSLGVKVFPTTLLVGADGSPRLRVRGAVDWTGPQAQRWVEALWQPAARR